MVIPTPDTTHHHPPFPLPPSPRLKRNTGLLQTVLLLGFLLQLVHKPSAEVFWFHFAVLGPCRSKMTQTWWREMRSDERHEMPSDERRWDDMYSRSGGWAKWDAIGWNEMGSDGMNDTMCDDHLLAIAAQGKNQDNAKTIKDLEQEDASMCVTKTRWIT